MKHISVSRPKSFLAIFALLTTSLASYTSRAQTSDLLQQAKIKITTSDLSQLIDETTSDIRAFAENFEINLDSKSKITKPKTVTGSVLEPVLRISVRKCVFIICQTVDLDAQFRLDKVANTGTEKCDHKYLLTVDLGRSTDTLSNLYNRIESTICMKEVKGGANVKLGTSIVRADSYEEGIVQRQTFDLIKRQSEAILNSLISVLKLKGASSVAIVP